MAMEVRVDDETDIIRDELGQIMTRIPEAEAQLSEEMMEIAVEELEKSFRRNFEDFTGETARQISMSNVQSSNVDDGEGLKLPLEGKTPRNADYLEWNENANEGHWVEIDRQNQPIYEWAQRNFNEIPSAVKVQPTPFIKPALKRMRRRMKIKAESDDNAVGEFARRIESEM